MAKAGARVEQDENAAPHAGDKAMRARLTQLSQRYSQSEIARRTHTPVSNVNRYLKQGRIPASFAGALVDGLGVNAHWLLTGEGVPSQAEVREASAGTATDLVELLRAMNSVARMKLGELTGDDRLKLLHELNQKLTTYEELRDALNERTRPFFERLLEDMTEAVAKRDLARAGEIQRAAAQVARLCDDDRLRARFEQQQFMLEFYRGSRERALEHQRSMFLRAAPKTGLADEEFLDSAFHYALALASGGRMDEARRIARSTLALLPGPLRRLKSTLALRAMTAIMDTELGDLRRAQTTYARVVPLLPHDQVQGARDAHQRCILLAGVATFAGVCAIDPFNLAGKATSMFELASVSESQDNVRLVLDRYADGGQSAVRDSMVKRHVRGLSLAFEGKIAEALQSIARQADDSWNKTTPLAAHDFVAATCSAQVLRIGGKAAQARIHLRRAQERLAHLTAESMPGVVIRATHFKNVLMLSGKPAYGPKQSGAVREAHRFFRNMLRRGYVMFAPLYAPHRQSAKRDASP